ncbi:DUF4129 domain-containing protein [Pseudolysinimonas kribbensis]|uniref:Protein-glutamine gamma-glutamyltransferase-like C-terminal domain-containing protein n=1 Tax=Pseudolysinimonas kribbensis TaxID=433641 RepID=A0ABQ6K0R1_9MICO|nr:DUF4129 domain-containing protein [Pseudolysinimonas kribbensis]GMA94196.1 hypothetical protein GCM10025881_10200 [Pseudolysinimonas kribbensis]
MIAPWVRIDVPVDPSAPVAQYWLEQELSKAQYQAGRPGLFEQILRSFLDWLQSIVPTSGPRGFPDVSGLVSVLGIAALAAILVIVFVKYGAPRLNRRSRAGGELFGEDDDRDADALRRDAARAAAAGDYATAIADMFRALARRLDERAVVSSFPGTTARGFARGAGEAFPVAAGRLGVGASDFESVRYLGAAGTVEQWERIRMLEADLRDARPEHAESLQELAETVR